MPMFRVELDRRLFRPGEHNRNPFYASIPAPGKTIEMSVRSWDFEAKDEAEVRKLLTDAQEQGIGNVRGYRLRSITLLHPSAGPNV